MLLYPILLHKAEISSKTKNETKRTIKKTHKDKINYVLKLITVNIMF